MSKLHVKSDSKKVIVIDGVLGSYAQLPSSQKGRKLADEMAAAVNWFREHGIDPTSADPLGEYRERVQREMREACAEWVGECPNLDGVKDAILAAPAPEGGE